MSQHSASVWVFGYLGIGMRINRLCTRVVLVACSTLFFSELGVAAELPHNDWLPNKDNTHAEEANRKLQLRAVLSVLMLSPLNAEDLSVKEQHDSSYPERKSWVAGLQDLHKPNLWSQFFIRLPDEQKTKRSLKDVSESSNQDLRDKIRDTKTNHVSQYTLVVQQSAAHGAISITYPEDINAEDMRRATDLVYFGGSASEGQLIVPAGYWIDAVHSLGKEAYGTLFIPPSQFGGTDEHRILFFANEPYDGAVGDKPRSEDRLYNKRYFVAESLAIIAHEMKLDGWLLNLEGPGDYSLELRGFVNWFQYYTRKVLLQELDWHQAPSLMIYVQFASGVVSNPSDYPNLLKELYPSDMGEFIFTPGGKDKRIPLTNYAKVRVLTNNLSDPEAHIDGLETLQKKITHTFESNKSSIDAGEYGMDGRTRELVSLDITMEQLGGRGNKTTYTGDPWGPVSFYKYDPIHNANEGNLERNKIKPLPFKYKDVAQHEPPEAPCYVPPSGRPPLCHRSVTVESTLIRDTESRSR